MSPASTDSSKVSEKPKKILGLIILLVFVVILWVGLGGIAWLLFPDMTGRGTFGDMFGVVNSLFAGLAFAGIIYTIFLQKEELRLQRKELELTRKELERSAGAQEKSQQALSEQVSAQLLTAKLNAYSSLVGHYGEEARSVTGNLTPAVQARQEAFGKVIMYLGQLETLVAKIRP